MNQILNPLSDILLNKRLKSWSKNINFKTVYKIFAKPISYNMLVNKHRETV